MEQVLVTKSNGQTDLSKLLRWFEGVKDGLYRIVINRVRKPRSADQNAWLWGCIYPLLLQGLNEAGWEFVDTQQVHEFFKAQMTADKVVNRATGEIIAFPKSTALMDTVAFAQYCEQLREYALEFLDIDIPDPKFI